MNKEEAMLSNLSPLGRLDVLRLIKEWEERNPLTAICCNYGGARICEKKECLINDKEKCTKRKKEREKKSELAEFYLSEGKKLKVNPIS